MHFIILNTLIIMRKQILFSLLILSTLISYPQGTKEITLEDIHQKFVFSGEGFYGMNYLNDGKHYADVDYSETGNKKLVRYHIASGSAVKTILEEKNLLLNGSRAKVVFESFIFSSDEKKLLFYGEKEMVYRHSSRENYYIYDLLTQQLKPVSLSGKQSLASFSPAGDQVAFVRNNNLFIMDAKTGKETQLTSDGETNKIINGACDWVYEEEFSFDQAYQWSPDGKKVAFFRFDESEVKEFNMQKWGALYPSDYRYKYPKAGEKNSVVTIHVYDLASGTTKMIDTGTETDQYIPRIKWTADPEVLCVTRMNRRQNKLELLLADCRKSDKNIGTQLLLLEESKTYIEIHDFLEFQTGNKTFTWVSDKDGWNHVYLYDISGKQLQDLSPGKFDINDVYGVDEKTGTLYYSSSEEAAMDKDVYAVNLNGSGKRKLSLKKGTTTAEFSPTFEYYVLSYSDANTPPEAAIYNKSGKVMRSVVDNEKLLTKMKDYKLSKKEFFSFKTSEGIELNGYMIKPKDFDPNKKYPVFMYVYGGPGSNTVQNQWGGGDYFWHQMLAQRGYIIVSVDNRGTGNRGKDFKHCTYEQLGKVETVDQIEAAKYLGSLSYIDKTRIGIFGWSYGGYMSSLCITKGADFFKAAIAVAPVTTWRYYDSIYTERYNGLPQDNPSGYDDNSPINHVSKIKGKYLLIHGTGDDNVHFQNSVEMTTALVKANKPFETMYYPDKNHSIYGGNTRMHLYSLITDFIYRNL